MSTMNPTSKFSVGVFYISNICIALAILVATKISPDTDLLRKVSIENGPYEIATALFLFVGAFLLLRNFLKIENTRWLLRASTLSMSIICFVGAGEELSWGQHWLKFESHEFFDTHNYQNETNLHNLINPVVFSTALNVVIYLFFVLLPLLHWTYPNNLLSRELVRRQWHRGIPTLDIALMLILAHCFHAWLLPATYSDTAMLVLCWALAFAACLKYGKHRVKPQQWVMLLLAAISFAICLWVHDIFRYKNMQYEIRECFTAFTIVWWALGWHWCPTNFASWQKHEQEA